MGKNFEEMMNQMLHHLVNRFNDYSMLVAINYKRGHESGMLQWNRGIENAYEEEARSLAKKLDRNVEYEMRTTKIL